MVTVLKFGGTSVGSAATIRQVSRIVGAAEGKRLVVVSAFAGVTNGLVEIIESLERGDEQGAVAALGHVSERCASIIHDLSLQGAVVEKYEEEIARLRALIPAILTLGEVTPRAADAILATGEIVSSFVVAAFLGALHLDARMIMITDDSFGAAHPDEAAIAQTVSERLVPLFSQVSIIVTGGYSGATKTGVTTTLGRGGSDYSAALFAAALGADRCEIWTDVNGLMSSDPRLVPTARTVPMLHYDEAAELAFFGAKVLHPLTIQPAVRCGIPVVIRNTFFPDGAATRIVGTVSGGGMKAVACRHGVAIVHIRSNRMLGTYGFLAELFEVFRRHRVAVDMVTTSEVSVSVTVDDSLALDALVADLSLLGSVDIERGCSQIALVGAGMRRQSGIGARFFSVLRDINILMVSMGASDTNLSVVLAEKDAPEALRRVHTAFFEKGEE